MSVENAVQFLETLDADEAMKDRLASAEPTATGWAAFAGDAGFEFGAGDLRAVSEAMTGKELTDATCVQAIVDIAAARLSDDDLEKVAGGVGIRASIRDTPTVKLGGGLTSKGILQRDLRSRRGDLGGGGEF